MPYQARSMIGLQPLRRVRANERLDRLMQFCRCVPRTKPRLKLVSLLGRGQNRFLEPVSSLRIMILFRLDGARLRAASAVGFVAIGNHVLVVCAFVADEMEQPGARC